MNKTYRVNRINEYKLHNQARAKYDAQIKAQGYVQYCFGYSEDVVKEIEAYTISDGQADFLYTLRAYLQGAETVGELLCSSNRLYQASHRKAEYKAIKKAVVNAWGRPTRANLRALANLYKELSQKWS